MIYAPGVTSPFRGRRFVGAVTATLLLAGCGSGSSSGSAALLGGSGQHPTFEPTHADLAEVRALLARRARSVLHHDEQAFLATVDDRDSSLVADQRTTYQNLTRLPLASLAYTTDMSSLLVPAEVKGTDPVLRPVVVEQVEIRGTMTAPVSNSVDQTFVRRDGHWLLGAESDPSQGPDGDAAGERPWYGVPIVARSDGPLTVMVDKSRAAMLGALTSEIGEDIDVDATLLGVPARHDILVDATSNGASTSFSTLSKEQAGAVTFGLAHTNAAGDRYLRPAGVAIKLNPHDVSRLVGSRFLLRHELTHFLLHAYLSSSPRWLSEGIANWVEYYPDDYPALRLSSDLYDRVTHADRELPTVGVFNYDPDVHYQIAQAAVTWLIAHGGMAKLLDLMRAYREGYQDANVDALTPRLLRQVYGDTERQVVDGAFGLIATYQH